MIYSGYRLWLIQADYKQEADLHGEVMEYRPREDEPANQSVIDLRAKYPDVVGWLSVPGTNIDYPFAQSEDNDYYLRRDLNGDYALAGTLFMDYRCQPDFTSRNTVIYGHHMKNGSMFGALKAFSDKTFFDAHQRGTVYLPYETLTLEFFAYLVIQSDDSIIYSTAPGGDYIAYVKQNARQYRDVGLTDGDRVVTLSSCAYEFDGARMVLLARVG
jgi:sortase B